MKLPALEGGLFYTGSAMAFLKLLTDVVNAEHWGIAKSARDLVANEFPDHAEHAQNCDLENIASVHFYNSLCIVEKAAFAEEGKLGKRVLKGREMAVFGQALELNGTGPIRSNEENNEYSVFVK